MNSKKPAFTASDIIKNAFKKAWLARLIAKAIDLFIVLLLSAAYFPLGFFIGIIYLAIGDSLNNGQSIGKRFIGMRVVDIETCDDCQWKQSLIRNLPMIAPLAFMIVPVLGWFLGGLIFIVFCAIEIYLFISFKSTQRLGDMMAETTVVVCGQDPQSEKCAHKTSWFEGNNINPCEN